jgi:hypothetical protein
MHCHVQFQSHVVDPILASLIVGHVMLIPVTKATSALGLRMEQTASRSGVAAAK